VSLSPELRLGLARQRRFLILMSLAVAGYAVLGVQPKGEGEYSGLAIKILHPERAQCVLWVIFGWAILRYCQRLYELWSDTKHDVLDNVNFEDRRLALKAARRLARRRLKNGELGDVPANAYVARAIAIPQKFEDDYAGTQQSAPKAAPDFLYTGDGGRKYERLSGALAWIDAHGAPGGCSFNFQMQWAATRTRLHRLRAWVWSIVLLPAVGEHWVPLFIAAAALVCAIVFHAQPTM